MRVSGFRPLWIVAAGYAALCFSIVQMPALAQVVSGAKASAGTTDADQSTTPDGKKLTPAEQRQKEIDDADPLRFRGVSPSDAPASQTRPVTPKSTPLPGSVAESNQPPASRQSANGPQVVDGQAAPTVQTYGGPAVLSRSYTIARPSVPKEIKWQWTLGSAEVYQTGLVTGSGTTGNAATNQDGFGTTNSFTFTGRHLWKADQFGVAYGASYSRYYGTNGYNGLNQNLSLDYAHQISRHMQFNLVEVGSILSSNYSLENPLTAPGVNIANVSLSASPASQLLDQRTRQFQTSAGLTWQKSARLSFNFNGGFFAVDRSGPQLTGNTGYQAQSDVNYRTSSRTTVGAYYSFTDYTFTKHENVAATHTVGLIYSYAFSKSTQLRLRGGFSRLESLAYTVVPIDPVFAILTGHATGLVDAYSHRRTSDISAQFVHDFGRSRTGNISYARGIAPGNGVILTSIQQTITAGFTAQLFRRYTVGLSGGRSELTAQSQNTGSYDTNYAGLTISRPLSRGLLASLSADYRIFNVTGMAGLQSQLRFSSGVSWGPGPGKLW